MAAEHTRKICIKFHTETVCCLIHNPKPQRNYLHKVLEMRKSKLVLSKKVLIPPRSTLVEDSLKSFCGLVFSFSQRMATISVLIELNGTCNFLGSTRIKYTSVIL